MEEKQNLNPTNEKEEISIQQLIDSIDEIIGICDANKRILMVNNAAKIELRKLLGEGPEYLIGSTTEETLKPFITDGVSIVSMVASQKRTLQKNIHYHVKDTGHDNTILYSVVPIMENDELKYLVATGRDMTRLAELEQKLAAAEKLNLYYSSIVSDMAEHDFSEHMVVTSKKMEDALQLAKRAAKSDAPVFITGESGVGKEEIAKYIHKKSARKDKPYLAINCAAIPRELIESELFGYVEGAFTGSRRGGKKGLIEEVDGGTLFLDEIGALPIELQTKLLRVLQEGTLRRVGANNDISVNVRYVSATNKTAESLLNDALFRQDLLYRLSVIPIFVPPIRERREDIIPLVEYFLKQYNTKYDRHVQLTSDAYSHLCTLPWRGNVRQIKNVVERIVILSEDGSLTKKDLLPVLKLDIDSPENTDGVAAAVVVSRLVPLAQAQADMERQLIDMALNEYLTVPKAAETLGVPPSTIYRKLKK